LTPFQLIFGTIFLVPIRFVGFSIFLILAWSLASISILGKTKEELQAEPLTGWRK
jgi:hypothetical protein